MLRAKEEELRESQMREGDWMHQVESLQQQVRSAQEEKREAMEERDALRREATELKNTISKLKTEAQHARNQITTLEQVQSTLQSERQSTMTLLETKAAELRDAQVFLDKVDDITDSDIVAKVKRLNAITFQTAAVIADAFQTRFSVQRTSETARQARAQLDAWGFIGRDLIGQLDVLDHRADPVLVQTALQAAIAAYTTWLCNTWDFRRSGQCPFETVYRKIKSDEPQSVAGRWRALSRAGIKAALRDIRREASGCLTELVTAILAASGAEGTSHEEEVRRVSYQAFQEIIALALEFQTVTGENIVSRDLVALGAAFGEVFDPVRMIDEWEDPKATRSGRVPTHPPVLCSTGLGLLREVKITREGEGDRGTFDTVLLLKPTVVLTNMLDELRSPGERRT
ncbi:hypothetical protein C8Q80DRAFT_1262841 [Daedaleopsis nitida]|nr:hypothetical protein C8Q80DRAFT_1262841 [Daedaleopsis nitida]